MYSTAPVGIEEPEGLEVEICQGTAAQPPLPAETRVGVIQMSADLVDAHIQPRQELTGIMSGSQSLNLSYGEVETCLIPQVTNPLQDIISNNKVEPKINVVGLDTADNITQNEVTNGVEVGDKTKEPQPHVSPCQVDPAVDNQTSDFEHEDVTAQSKSIACTSQTESVTVTHHQDTRGEQTHETQELDVVKNQPFELMDEIDIPCGGQNPLPIH